MNCFIVLAALVAACVAEEYAAPVQAKSAAQYGYDSGYGGYDGYGKGGYGYDAGYGKDSYGYDAGYGKDDGYGKGGHGGGHGGGYGYDHKKYGYLGFIHPYGRNPYEPDKYADCPQGHYCGKLVGYGGQCKGKYDGFYPDKDCNKYHQCSNGYDYLLACPYGLHWSSKYYRCVYPVHSECGGYGGH